MKIFITAGYFKEFLINHYLILLSDTLEKCTPPRKQDMEKKFQWLIRLAQAYKKLFQKIDAIFSNSI